MSGGNGVVEGFLKVICFERFVYSLVILEWLVSVA